jgi:riboflavin biosynthesis pyrimidine reductase
VAFLQFAGGAEEAGEQSQVGGAVIADQAGALEGDRTVEQSVTKLKQDPELNVLMHGYGPVARTLLRHDLLDELILWVHPMLAGAGTIGDMIFTEELNTRLALLDVQRLGSGVVLLSYGAS